MAANEPRTSARPTQRTQPEKLSSRFGRIRSNRQGLLGAQAFYTMLTLERRRAERSRKPFVLILVDSRAVHQGRNGSAFADRLASAALEATRETDIVGWYEECDVLGVIFTEISTQGKTAITEVLRSKVQRAFSENLDNRITSKLLITAHLFPENWDQERPDRAADRRLYPELSGKTSKKRLPLALKRAIDIVGSGLLLVIFSPILAAIALAIKLTSKGPVIFKQERVGQFGRGFACLKFRTMHTDNDPRIHREYVHRLITGSAGGDKKSEAESSVYKIADDPRVTRIGKFLRRTSLDEFPQFWNVLRGEMSLVGPRPPLPYEFEIYDCWHRRRVLEVKPGVTGLWQVCGRSRTCFDDMVRLDLRYSQTWSLWLDIKILFATPRAVITGEGAY